MAWVLPVGIWSCVSWPLGWSSARFCQRAFAVLGKLPISWPCFPMWSWSYCSFGRSLYQVPGRELCTSWSPNGPSCSIRTCGTRPSHRCSSRWPSASERWSCTPPSMISTRMCTSKLSNLFGFRSSLCVIPFQRCDNNHHYRLAYIHSGWLHHLWNSGQPGLWDQHQGYFAGCQRWSWSSVHFLSRGHCQIQVPSPTVRRSVLLHAPGPGHWIEYWNGFGCGECG